MPLPFGEVFDVLYAQGILLLYGQQPERDVFNIISCKMMNTSAVWIGIFLNILNILKYLCELMKPARIWLSDILVPN